MMAAKSEKEQKSGISAHIMTGSEIGENCNIGQNVVISPGVKLGRNVKVQNNVSIYTGVICEDDVFLGPSMVFTNVINPRSAIIRKDSYYTTIVEKGSIHRSKFHNCLREQNRNICIYWCRCSCYKRCKTLCTGCRKSCQTDRLDE